MTWNTLPEIVALIIVSIISVYSRRSHGVPSPKNRLFHACLTMTMAASIASLCSSYLIMFAPLELAAVTWLATAAHFALTPLLAATYFYYTSAVIDETRPLNRTSLALCAAPCLAYLICVAASAATGWLFSIDATGAYHRGPFYYVAYLVAYFYCAACLFVVALSRDSIRRDARRILATFPLLAFAVVFAQQMFPQHLLSGAAAACALLIIYLYLQNKRLSVDLLTGTPNRQEFLSMVSFLHDRGQGFTVVLVSISNFKFINDRFGNENGDRFLQEFASFLSAIKGCASLYRYSGDQFAFVFDERACKDRDASEAASDVVEQLRQSLCRTWSIGAQSYSIGFVMGVVSHPDIADNPQDVSAALEYAVARAKALEPGTPCMCTPEMIDEIHRRSAIADALRKAIAERSLSTQIQPIWFERTEEFVMAEVLCRLNDEKLGAIPPNEFISIAEQTGLIASLTEIVLEEACAFAASYRAAHPNTSMRGVSVNFSAVQFIQNDLAETVLAIVRKHGIPPSFLRIEITESAIAANPDTVRSFMNTMNEQGVKFYLDDFGTGYSNVALMLELPFDVVKLDKSILKSIAEDDRGHLFLEHLIACFTSTGSYVLCEGVETAEQRSMLRQCGCTLMQGYLLSKPLPPSEAAAIIAKHDKGA
ncbi:MAG: hypothetical protein PEGG_00689 [Paraeggerthella hongkongensis]